MGGVSSSSSSSSDDEPLAGWARMEAARSTSCWSGASSSSHTTTPGRARGITPVS